MHAIWFTEKESVIRGGTLIWTGRKRQNVSHFECDCGKSQPVDDTFAGVWSN